MANGVDQCFSELYSNLLQASLLQLCDVGHADAYQRTVIDLKKFNRHVKLLVSLHIVGVERVAVRSANLKYFRLALGLVKFQESVKQAEKGKLHLRVVENAKHILRETHTQRYLV